MDVRILTRIRHENSKHLPKFFNTTQLRSTPNFKKVFEIFVEELKTECFLAGHHLDLKDSQLERIFELLSLAKPDKKSNSYDVIAQSFKLTSNPEINKDDHERLKITQDIFFRQKHISLS